MNYRIAIGPSSFAAEDDGPLRRLHEAGAEIIPNPFGRRLTEDEIIAQLKDADGLLAGLEPLGRRVLESAPRLKAIARVGINTMNVDFEAARESGVKVSNTPDEPTHAVAEMTLTALLAILRGLVPTDKALHAGEWKKSVGRSLLGVPVLMIGCGRIGRKTAEFFRLLGAEILVHDPFLDEGSLKNGERAVSLEEGLREADVVSLHASGGETILGDAQFSAMRDGAILLNSARGELVDEEAFIRALDSGKIAGAWFDAFWEEPYKGRLLKYDQVLMTPHMGTYTRQCRRGMEMAAVENLLRDLDADA